MAHRKKLRTRVNLISTKPEIPEIPEIPEPKNSRHHSSKIKLDLETLLADTPEHSIDFDWETMQPFGREFR
jgi:hypothetical protein